MAMHNLIFSLAIGHYEEQNDRMENGTILFLFTFGRKLFFIDIVKGMAIK